MQHCRNTPYLFFLYLLGHAEAAAAQNPTRLLLICLRSQFGILLYFPVVQLYLGVPRLLLLISASQQFGL